MSYFKSFPVTETYQRDEIPKPQPKPPIDTLARAVAVLADARADDADKLRAWLRAGIEIGAIQLRDADHLQAFRR